MTRKFRKALDYVLKNEGGDSNHPLDRGHATRFGITTRTAARYGYNIHSLTLEQAGWIYEKSYWDFEWIISEPLAIKVFDLAVNMGNAAANKLLQTATNDCGMCLAVDGLIGPKTRFAVNALQPDVLINKLIDRAKERYADIIAEDPTQKVFERGWMARAERVPDGAKEIVA